MAKRKLTKEDIEKLIKYKNTLIKSKAKYFAKVSPAAENEIKSFNSCSACKFLSKECHNTCGIMMKWLNLTGKANTSTSYGKSDRITTDSEHYDTTGVRLGIDDEVEEAEINELEDMSEAMEEMESEDIASYEVSEDGE